MEITNNTQLQAEIWLGHFPDDKPCLATVVKGTFSITSDQPPVLSEEQIPIFFADQPYDKLKYPSAIRESDMVPFKPRSDIVLLGRAWAPGGKPTQTWDVSVSVGRAGKSIRVVGNRTWKFGAVGPVPTRPEPVEFVDLVYERAYGGVDQPAGAVFRKNRLGCGFFAKDLRESMEGASLPNLENPSQPLLSWQQRPDPVGFGFYPRSNSPRLECLGTIDEKWSNERAPRLPLDFNPAYYNGAHPDLQMEGVLEGTEHVELRNLTPEGHIRFPLPGLRPRVRVWRYDQAQLWLLEDQPDEAEAPDPDHDLGKVARHSDSIDLKLDTLVLLPEERRFYLVWRGRTALKSLETFAAEVAGIEVAVEDEPSSRGRGGSTLS